MTGSSSNIYQWAVIGGGPAGMAAVGRLIDNGIPGKEILWLDPKFKVGDLGEKWRNVSSNTKVDLFRDFLNASDAFRYENRNDPFVLDNLPGEETCELKHIADPLQWVSDNLREQVESKQAKVTSLLVSDKSWQCQCKDQSYTAKNVILATGAEPKQIPLDQQIETIPIEIALDADKLASAYQDGDTIALFGSSHSAIIILRHLHEQSRSKIINFYQSPLKYAVYTPEGIVFDNTGLKGTTAAWAREFLHGKRLGNVERVISNTDNLAAKLPHCNKVIHATGFAKRQIPVEGLQNIDHNPHSGIIAPGLFGYGIGFPELTFDPMGTPEYSVGLWKFMVYLKRVMPVWLNYGM